MLTTWGVIDSKEIHPKRTIAVCRDETSAGKIAAALNAANRLNTGDNTQYDVVPVDYSAVSIETARQTANSPMDTLKLRR